MLAYFPAPERGIPWKNLNIYWVWSARIFAPKYLLLGSLILLPNTGEKLEFVQIWNPGMKSLKDLDLCQPQEVKNFRTNWEKVLSLDLLTSRDMPSNCHWCANCQFVTQSFLWKFSMTQSFPWLSFLWLKYFSDPNVFR